MFVDDEPLVLRGIERSLQRLRPKWAATYCESAALALGVLEHEPIDIIVTDVGMPEMDGIAFMRVVRQHYPHVARLVLSGETRSTDRLRGILEIHQWLAKPSAVEDIVAVVERTYAPRAAVADRGVLAGSSGIGCLPSRLAFYRAAARASEQAAPLDTCIAIIERDIGMTAKLIQLVNSAFFGPPQRITSVRRAAEALGVQLVRDLMVTAEVSFHPDVEQVTADSLLVADLARSVATSHHDDVYLAAFLHDVGSLVATSSDRHAAPLLLATWGLPDEVVNAVALCRDPDRAVDPREPRLCAVALAVALMDERRGRVASPAIVDARAATLGLDPARCRRRTYEPGISSTMPSTTLRPRSTL